MQRITFKVDSVESLTSYVKQIKLTGLSEVDFKAGQYCSVVMAEDDKRPFSIAAISNDNNQIELHIGASKADSWAQQVIDRMTDNDSVEIELPSGKAHWREESVRPMLLVAGGTGFSYVYSILLARLQGLDKAPLFLYWGVKTPQDLYFVEQLKQFEKDYPFFTFVPVVEHQDPQWQGRNGLLLDAILADFVSLESYDIYGAGRFEMIGIMRQQFHQQGAHLEHMFADAFEFI